MGFSELLLIAVGLSMDAFAVAVCKGLKSAEKKRNNGCFADIKSPHFQPLANSYCKRIH